uniref:SSD domain-containing protein n=1 Tax=Romanomermis culicivorax TaxID=13658 RepID=A0A915KAX8_ROMCU
MDRFPWKSRPKFPPEAKSDTSSEDGETENETEEENSNDSDQIHQVDEKSHHQKGKNKSFMISKVRNSVSSDHDQDNQSSVFAASSTKKTSGSSKSAKKNEQKQKHKENSQNLNDNQQQQHKNRNQRNTNVNDSAIDQRKIEQEKRLQHQHEKTLEKGKTLIAKKIDKESGNGNGKKSKKSDLLPKLLTSLNDSIAAENQEKNGVMAQQQSTVEKPTKVAEKWSPSKPLPAEPLKSNKKTNHCGDTCKIIKWKPFCCVDNEFRRLSWHLGEFISKHFLIFFAVTTIFCSLSGLGVLLKRQNIAITAPFEYFKPPDKAKSPDAANIDAIFNASNKRYDSIRRRSSSDFAFIFKTATDDGNLLREDIIEDYVTLKRAVDEIKVVDHSNKLYKYSTLCRGGSQDSLAAASSCNFNVVEAAMFGAKSVKFRYPEMDVAALLNATFASGLEKDSASIFSANIFGGVETDLDGSIARSQALAAHFKLLEVQNDLTASSTNDQDQQTSATLELKTLLNQWDSEFQKLMIKENDKSKLYKLCFWSKRAFDSTVAETFRLLYVYSSIMIGILIVCSILIMAKIFGCRKVTVWSSMGPISTFMAVFTVIGSLCLTVGVNGYFNSAILPAIIVIAG